jgi:hypothetical protein
VRRAAGPVVVGVLATILASVLVSNRVAAAPAVTGYIACLVACAVWWLLQGTRRRGRGAPDLMTAALARGATTPAAPRAADLVQLERVIAAARGSALDAQARLRPRLRALACSLLSSRRAVELDPATADVAAFLGAPGEPLLERPPDRRPSITERGPTLDALAKVIERLEAI